jgi:hypothetical protein
VKRLKIFTWHIHGSYLYYLSQIPHDIYIPKKTIAEDGYAGITPSYPWPSNLYEIPSEKVSQAKFDCILYQSHKNYISDQYEVLSVAQRELPKMYLEHDPPRDHPTDTKHPVDDPNVMVVHVTDFNRLMWDCGRSPTTVIDHGVMIPQSVKFHGHIERGIVVVNNIKKRGRRLGLDIFENARSEVALDLVGMGWKDVNGLGEIPHAKLPAFCSQYRFFFNPIRYTSLGLSICEAMMVGMPIIGLATAELVTVIENERSGFLSTRADELVEVSKELLRSPKLAEAWGREARKTALRRFSIQRFIDDWNRTLSEVTQTRDPLTFLRNEESSWTLQS